MTSTRFVLPGSHTSQFDEGAWSIERLLVRQKAKNTNENNHTPSHTPSGHVDVVNLTCMCVVKGEEVPTRHEAQFTSACKQLVTQGQHNKSDRAMFSGVNHKYAFLLWTLLDKASLKWQVKIICCQCLCIFFLYVRFNFPLPHYLPPHTLNKVMGLPIIFRAKVGEKLLPCERILKRHACTSLTPQCTSRFA